MPSRGMRRSTRVFGARVLRSGRRLWTEPYEGRRYRKVHNGETDCIELVNKSSERGNTRDDCNNVQQEVDNRGLIVEPIVQESASEGVMELKDEDRFGIVYNRKRKRSELKGKCLSVDKKFRKKYARKQWRKKPRVTEPLELVIFAYDFSCDSSYWITRFLTSVLSYMTKIRIGVRRLSAFVLSKPISDAYFSHGVAFLQDSSSIRSPGFCVISGSRSLRPLFSVDFSAIPFCFMRMHTNMYIRSLRFFCFFADSPCVHEEEEEPMDVLDGTMEPSVETPFDGGDHSDIVPMASATDNSGKRAISSSTKSGRRNMQFKNSRNIQKRRTSLRLKRRSTSVNRAQKDSGALSADFLRIKHSSSHFSATAPSRVLRSSSSNKRNSTTSSSKMLKSNLAMLKQGVSTSTCSANLLVIEPDKCYREEGVVITIERSIAKRFFLAIKKDGINRYTLTAQNVMTPPSSNRLNHATIWVADGSWKLEFPNKQDWLIFKELYKECSERNIKASAASVIPIPKVQEVSNLYDSDYVPFVRPDSYITVKDDELTRTLVKTSANYDMDSDDEEWLKNFNAKLFAGGELQQLTPDRFELIIDELEKGIHCTGDELFAGKTADDSFMHIDTVRSYWMNKRKQKHSSIVRIFQLYKPTRRNPVITKPVLRKKRSFKRQMSHAGRGKPRPFLQAIAEELDAQEQKRNLEKVQKAKASADNFEELAVLKRQRAQKLMENADLATYKAVIALRIAEAAQVAAEPESSLGTVASFFLG